MRMRTAEQLLIRGNTTVVVAVALLDLLRTGARSPTDPEVDSVRDSLDAWARDARAAASEWAP